MIEPNTKLIATLGSALNFIFRIIYVIPVKKLRNIEALELSAIFLKM